MDSQLEPGMPPCVTAVESSSKGPASTPRMDLDASLETGKAMRALKGEDFTCTLHVPNGPRLSAVADGHGGAAASRHVCQNARVLHLVAEGLKNESLAAACHRAFLKVHEEVRALPGTTAGTTLTVVAMDDAKSELTLANVGDSGALFVGTSESQVLTASHRLQTNAQERERITKLGAVVAQAARPGCGTPYGPLRAWPGGIVCTRAIGDGDCGDLVSAKVRLSGVCPPLFALLCTPGPSCLSPTQNLPITDPVSSLLLGSPPFVRCSTRRTVGRW